MLSRPPGCMDLLGLHLRGTLSSLVRQRLPRIKLFWACQAVCSLGWWLSGRTKTRQLGVTGWWRRRPQALLAPLFCPLLAAPCGHGVKGLFLSKNGSCMLVDPNEHSSQRAHGSAARGLSLGQHPALVSAFPSGVECGLLCTELNFSPRANDAMERFLF